MGINVLTENFMPQVLKYRQNQIGELSKTFTNFEKMGYSGNVMLTGRTGTGKTATIKKVMNDFSPTNYIYTSGATNDRTLKLLRFIANCSNVPFERAIETAIKNLKENPKIIILDEVNKVRDLPDLFNLLNTIYRETTIPIIVITNRPKMSETMEVDAQKTLLFERIDFKPYNAEQLYDIVFDRVKLLNGEFNLNVEEGPIRYICAKCAEDGSARDAIGIVFKCFLNKDFSSRGIKKVEKSMEEEEWLEYVNTLKSTEVKFLRVILDLYANEISITPKEIQRKLGLTTARISQLIKFFEKDVIDVSYVYHTGKGAKKGRYAKIDITSHDLFCKLDGLVF